MGLAFDAYLVGACSRPQPARSFWKDQFAQLPLSC